MNETDINRAIRDLVRLTTSMDPAAVRPANTDIPATGTYATVLIDTGVRKGVDDSLYGNIPGSGGDDAMQETATGQRVGMASISFIRGSAKMLASKFLSRITLASARQRMQELGIGFVSTSSIRTLSAVINSAWEDRAQLDMTFHYVDTEIDQVPYFKSFTFETKTTTGPQGDETNTQTSEVTAP